MSTSIRASTLLAAFLSVHSSSFAENVTTTSRAKALNPDISLSVLGLAQYGDGLSDDRTQPPFRGFSLQEAELQISADVDPYLRAVGILGLHQEAGGVDFGIEPEEIYLETLSLPAVTLKVGKFKLALTRHNLTHPHAFPFIDAPLIHQAALGDEGLAEVGGSAAVLLPAPWFSELTLQLFSPSNETLFLADPVTLVPGSPKSGFVGAVARARNLWDLSDDFTLELGLAGVSGKNALNQGSTVVGGDLTVKWRPSEGGKYHSLVWSSEYLNARRTDRLGGLASWVQYQFAERWWIQGRVERLGLPRDSAATAVTRMSALLGFFPSEFSGFRLQVDRSSIENAGNEDRVALQYSVSIGAHPAHVY